ncbi:MAG TPA: hypothetical protein VHL78_06805 [Actinomycetota bacterium]|nr:hypothetical protein [Actinomycetota bacterium]
MDELLTMGRETVGGASRRRPGRRWVALVLAPAAALALAAGAYAIITPPAEDVVNGIGCYAEGRTDSDGAFVGADGRDPVEVCAEIWEDGAMVQGVRQAPPLVACVAPEGDGVSVFPGDPGICQRLGMSPLPQGYRHAAARFAAMREELVRRTHLDAPQNCMGVDDARAITREVLDAHGLTAWSIEVGPAPEGEGRECVSLAFDPRARTVTLLRAVEY